MISTSIPSDVLQVLKDSTITSDSLFLPGTQLDRALYEKVNKVIKNYGGKWHTGKKCHKFDSDPREKFAEALGTGKTVNEQQRDQSFFTPADLADQVAILAAVEGMAVLEPSAGRGALAKACRKFGARTIFCVEQNVEHAAFLKSEYETVCRDFLTLEAKPEFDRVVMNPPFTRGADIKHIKYALKFLKPGGRLVSIMARKHVESIGEGVSFQIQPLPEKSFASSGTNVATQLMIVDVP